MFTYSSLQNRKVLSGIDCFEQFSELTKKRPHTGVCLSQAISGIDVLQFSNWFDNYALFSSEITSSFLCYYCTRTGTGRYRSSGSSCLLCCMILRFYSRHIRRSVFVFWRRKTEAKLITLQWRRMWRILFKFQVILLVINFWYISIDLSFALLHKNLRVK